MIRRHEDTHHDGRIYSSRSYLPSTQVSGAPYRGSDRQKPVGSIPTVATVMPAARTTARRSCAPTLSGLVAAGRAAAMDADPVPAQQTAAAWMAAVGWTAVVSACS